MKKVRYSSYDMYTETTNVFGILKIYLTKYFYEMSKHDTRIQVQIRTNDNIVFTIYTHTTYLFCKNISLFQNKLLCHGCIILHLKKKKKSQTWIGIKFALICLAPLLWYTYIFTNNNFVFRTKQSFYRYDRYVPIIKNTYSFPGHS